MRQLSRIPALGVVLGVLIATSCVSNKKVTYLQYEDELDQPESILTDSLVRMYEAGDWGYQLQPNDLLSITVSSQTPEEFNPLYLADRYMVSGAVSGSQQGQAVGYRLDPSGILHLPVVGAVNASGMTLKILENTINNRLQTELEDPVTKVNILNFKFSVLGEVGTQNTLFSDDNSLTMLQAVSMAGGVSEFGDISRIKVVRWIGEEHYVYYVNLLDESFLSSEFYFIQPNDVIIVSPLKARSYLKYVNPNLGIITSSISLLLSIVTLFAIFN